MALTKTKPKVVVRKEWLPKKGFAKSLSCASTTIVRNVELKCPKMEIVAAFKVTPEAMPCTLVLYLLSLGLIIVAKCKNSQAQGF